MVKKGQCNKVLSLEAFIAKLAIGKTTYYCTWSMTQLALMECTAVNQHPHSLELLVAAISVRSVILMPAFCILAENLVFVRRAPGVKTPPLPRRETMALRSSRSVRAACTRKMGVAMYPGSGPEISSLTSLSGSLPAEAPRPDQ